MSKKIEMTEEKWAEQIDFSVDDWSCGGNPYEIYRDRGYIIAGQIETKLLLPSILVKAKYKNEIMILLIQPAIFTNRQQYSVARLTAPDSCDFMEGKEHKFDSLSIEFRTALCGQEYEDRRLTEAVKDKIEELIDCGINDAIKNGLIKFVEHNYDEDDDIPF